MKVEGRLPLRKIESLKKKGFEVFETKVNTFISTSRPCNRYSVPTELNRQAIKLIISSEAVVDYGLATAISGLSGKPVPPNEVRKTSHGIIAKFTTLVSAVTVDAYVHKGTPAQVVVTKYLARIKQGNVCLDRETLFEGQFSDLRADGFEQFEEAAKFAINCELNLETSHLIETGRKYVPQLSVGDLIRATA